MNRYKACLEDHGYKVEFIDHNGYYSTELMSNTEIDGSVELNCAKGTTLYIPDLYERSITDPNNGGLSGFIGQVYSCMKRNGLVPDGYTVREYESDVMANVVTVSVGPDGPLSSVPAVPPPTFPYFDAQDPIRQACMDNPQNPDVRHP